MLKFGIYTTFYNCERFVDRIFNSIEGINYENFEWHITDDFSSDRTKEMVLDRLDSSSIKDKIKYFDQTEKKQMYWKPNLFFDSTFDWIVLVDADDDFDKNFLNVYNFFLADREDLTMVSSDCFKLYEKDGSLHSISYLLNDDQISKKIERYHPSCDYLNNISYSCFGLLRGFKHVIPSFDIDDMLACAEDSYHVFWANSYGKYLHIPRSQYVWYLRDDSESHSKSVPPNFNANFEIALNKLNKTDGGVDKTFNDLYLETSTLSSHGVGSLTGKEITLWTRSLSGSQMGLLEKLYYDSTLRFNSLEGEIHLICLNYINCETLDRILPELKGREILFYYQNQKYHSTNEEKDRELQSQLDSFLPTINKYVGFSWWTYIRHFIIRTQ
jgi:glycosyltransferase involved in cell wall biosynthesis